MRLLNSRTSARLSVASSLVALALGSCVFDDPVPKMFLRLGYSRTDGTIDLFIYQCESEPSTVQVFLEPRDPDGPLGEAVLEAESQVEQSGVITLSLGPGHLLDDFVTSPEPVEPPSGDFVVAVGRQSDEHFGVHAVSKDDVPQAPAVGRRTSGSDLTMAEFEDEASEAC